MYVQSLDDLWNPKDGDTEARALGRECGLAFFNPPDKCFLCGNVLEDDLVMWAGNDGTGHELWLHRECVLGLAAGLMFDYITGKQKMRAQKNQGT